MKSTPFLYPENRAPRLPDTVFRHPGAEYRGAPFWAWNSALAPARLRRQIAQFARMGFGGFHLHARTGLPTPYLGKEFMARVRECVTEAKRRRMLAWLYDEDRWPSGFGGGLVTRDPQHRLKYLLFTRTPYNGTVRPTPNWSCALAGRLENGTLLARYAVRLDAAGGARYRRLRNRQRTPADCEEWFAYLETADVVPWFGGQTYVDTLSPAATERFVALTHERYRANVGRHFGKTVPAIFTDEPQHVFKTCFDHAWHGTDQTLPITTDFLATFRTTHGIDLLDALPELFWELPGGRASVVRWRYHDHVTQRFADAYACTLGRWCERNGLLLTGHMMEEPTLSSQTHATGEAMRSLAHFQLPGVDLLCDEFECTTLKQAQSIAHQYGRAGVASELCGVTGWHFDFVGHKAQGDWQAALGVTVRVPHLAWLSMAGEAKRDYPASIHHQSPWWKEYRLIEDHFARVNAVMSRGRPRVRIAVIHPIESFWLAYGPREETKAERARQERQFAELPQWLLGQQLDFNYLSEGLLPTQSAPTARRGDTRFIAGEMAYDVVVVPPLRTLRATTLARLEAFAASGGAVIFAGEAPALVDAVPSCAPWQLARKVTRCEWSESALAAALEPWRELDCVDASGRRAVALLHQWRDDGDERHLFLCNRDRVNARHGLTLRVAGQWRVFERNTFTGRTGERAVSYGDGRTRLDFALEAHGHLLLTLRPGRANVRPTKSARWREVSRATGPMRVKLSEPNVLLLDQPEWRWNGGAWQPREEMLRLHNRVRGLCGLRPREGHVVQPWADREPAPVLGRVELRFRLRSHVRLTRATLALENPLAWRLHINGRDVSVRDAGWWVDEAIRRVPLPRLGVGTHELVLCRDFTRKTELEWIYLLGDFGVKLRGRSAVLTPPVRELAFGDWTKQGLPFYAGNVTYWLPLPSAGARTQSRHRTDAVDFTGFQAPLLTARAGRGLARPVAFAPFRFELPRGSASADVLQVTAFGNRANAFGPLHHTNLALRWQGPDAWRSAGAEWTEGYRLRPMGLLRAPRWLRREG